MDKETCFKIISALGALLIFGILLLAKYSMPQHNLQINTGFQIDPNTTLSLVGNYSAPGCPAYIGTTYWIRVLNSSGFTNYSITNTTLAKFDEQIPDFVIKPGTTGVIRYSIIRSDTPIPSFNGSAKLTAGELQPRNVTNQVYFSLMNPSFTKTLGETGLKVYLSSESVVIQHNSSANVELSFNVSSFAATQTYQLSLGPSFCIYKWFLLTVGDSPYNGRLPQIIFPA